jgi:hypothetical protein
MDLLATTTAITTAVVVTIQLLLRDRPGCSLELPAPSLFAVKTGLNEKLDTISCNRKSRMWTYRLPALAPVVLLVLLLI